MEATLKKTGVPREIISDHGGDVKAGVDRFSAAPPTTTAIYDIKHKTATVLQQELEGDSAWQEFTQLCQQTKHQVQLWSEFLQVIAITAHVVRTQGLERGTPKQLRQLLAPLVLSPRAARVRAHLLAFVTAEAVPAHPSERLLGSREVIESVLGKFKRLEATQGKSGFTGLLLTIGAMVGQTTHEVIDKARETVPTKRVLEWRHKTLGDSLQAERRKACAVHSQTEQKCNQEQEAA